jgi:D-aminoacyl-tRNA deacylase
LKAVLQRVTNASVTIDAKKSASINSGLLMLVGIEDADIDEDITWLSNKIVNLRIFNDENNIPNLSVKEIDGEILLVSQFTLHADIKKGNRPSYIKASKPDVAIPLYEKLIVTIESIMGKKIATGVFGADMQIALVNDGPMTIVIDTKNKSSL